MPVKFWWPTSMPAQLVLIQNFKAKIDGYSSVLPLTAAQVKGAKALCDAYIGAFNLTEQCRQTMVAFTAWRDECFHGGPVGKPMEPAPIFPVVGTVVYTKGTVDQFFALRELILASPGYTLAMGEDLGIVGTEIVPRNPSQVTPVFKSVTSQGYTVNVTGTMMGMDALRIEYAPKGGTFRTVAFLTNTPGGFTITPAQPNQPETGHIRAVYIKKNVEFGNWSADYPVTVS